MSYADSNGISFYYDEQGEGEPLVLLHGGIGSGEMFASLAPALAAAGRRVIRIDLQGHGRTGTWTGRSTSRRWPTTSPG